MPESNPNPEARICNPGQDAAILFARTPLPGRVKSRLQPQLTPEQALRLHVAATLDTADFLDGAFPGEASIARWIFWSEPPAPDSRRLGLPLSFVCAIQQGKDLGERMADAFARAFASGARRVVIVGSDSPHLPASRLPQSLAALDDHDCVLGPAEDGGYYLIGCRRFDSGLFHGVEWGSSQVLEQTRANAARLGYLVSVLESCYDLDEWRDVERLIAEARRGLALPPRVAAFLKQLEKEKGE